jgi:thioredoxin
MELIKSKKILSLQIMRSLNIIATILIFSAISCKGQQDRSENGSGSAAAKTYPAENEYSTTPVPADKPMHLTKADFLKLVMDYEKNTQNWIFLGDKPCLIDFYADWCAPCRVTSPILEDLAQEYAGKITIYKIDVAKEKELAAVFGVQSIPTFLFCPMTGNPTISSGIANSEEATRKLFIRQIEELLLKNVDPSDI